MAGKVKFRKGAKANTDYVRQMRRDKRLKQMKEKNNHW